MGTDEVRLVGRKPWLQVMWVDRAPGDLMAVHGTGIESKVIEEITGGEESHVGIIYSRADVLEATGKGVGLSPCTNYLGGVKTGNVRLYRPPGSDLEKKAAVRWTYNHWKGSRYPFLEVVLGYPLVYLASLFGWSLYNPFAQKTPHCSELAIRCYRQLQALRPTPPTWPS